MIRSPVLLEELINREFQSYPIAGGGCDESLTLSLKGKQIVGNAVIEYRAADDFGRA